MKLLAPAKINLSLRVLGKREDGFHAIETLMAPISLGDTLTLEREGAGIAFSCSEPALADPETNLAVRAARLFFAHTGISPQLRLHLEKRVPHGAGLGGGSSDAATVLLGLNRLFGAGLNTPALVSLAAQLGSDIPFFLYKSPAICTGRGEIVQPTTLEGEPHLVLIKPPFGVPTPWAYQRWSSSKPNPAFRYEPQAIPAGVLVNDLERPVFEKYLFLGLLKNWLLTQLETEGALMSGSGSTCFALTRTAGAAEELSQRALEQFGETMWITHCRVLHQPAPVSDS